MPRRLTAVRLLNNGGTVSLWTSYAYDALDQLVSVTGGKGNVTSSVYDNLGRRTALISPDAGRTDYVYDAASNLSREHIALGNGASQGERRPPRQRRANDPANRLQAGERPGRGRPIIP